MSALLAIALLDDLPAQPGPTRADRVVDSLVRRMTLEEKLGQLTQVPGRWGDTGPRVPEGGEDEIRKGQVGSFLGVFGAGYTREMQAIAMQSRLKIPLLFAHDVIHGFRTIFPVSIAEAASWDPEAVERAARIAATEATAAGLHWTFAPMVDIARDARWGRIVEGAGEDPYLGSIMAAARVRGFQGTDLSAPNTMLATAKHFVAYGAAEGGRDYNIADIPETTLRDVYLPPFHAAVDAGAGSIMASFNEVAGVPVHASERLIDGVASHGVGMDRPARQRLDGRPRAHSSRRRRRFRRRGSARAARGRRCGHGKPHLFPKAACAGSLGPRLMRDVDLATRRVLRAKYDLGLFEDPYPLQRYRARAAHAAGGRAPGGGAGAGAEVDRAAQKRGPDAPAVEVVRHDRGDRVAGQRRALVDRQLGRRRTGGRSCHRAGRDPTGGVVAHARRLRARSRFGHE